MSERYRYRKRETQVVTAVRLDLEMDGFTYQKWGGPQRCKRGDWVVDNAGDVYTVDAGTFERTYRHRSQGAYEKIAPVWAEQADSAGQVRTKEGSTAYEPGDYLVFNEEGGGDAYAVSRVRFEEMYELSDQG
jgi:hypothetical protein